MSADTRSALLKLAAAQKIIVDHLRQKEAFEGGEEWMGDPELDRAADLNHRAQEQLKG